MTTQSNENFSLDYFDLAVLEEDLYYQNNVNLHENYFVITALNAKLYAADKILKKGSYVIILGFSVRQKITEPDINNNFVLRELICPFFYQDEKIFTFVQIGHEPITNFFKVILRGENLV